MQKEKDTEIRLSFVTNSSRLTHEQERMNPHKLKELANSVSLESDSLFTLRVAFGVACAVRVAHFLTDSEISEYLQVGNEYVRGSIPKSKLAEAAKKAKISARSHPGSGLIDGCGNAAVSSSYCVAAALASHALVAAEYSAYASVYAYSSSAVTDPTAYSDEHEWQVSRFQELLCLSLIHI